MSQKPFIRVDLDAWKAQAVALVLFGLCIGRALPRHRLEQILAEVLSDNRDILELTEIQRRLVLRLCYKTLDRIYKK